MRHLLFLALATVLVGCGEPQSGAPDKSPVEVAASQSPSIPIGPPDFDHTSALAMVRAAHSKPLQIGMSSDDALGVYTGPPGAYSRSDLPPAIPSALFEAQGWQTKDEGFGMILYKGRVALALYEQDRTSLDRVDDIVRLEQDALGTPNIMPGKDVSYWFWKSPEKEADQLLMVCSTQVQSGKYNVSLALGTASLMGALGMTPEAAGGPAGDREKAEKLIERRKTHIRANQANSANPTGG